MSLLAGEPRRVFEQGEPSPEAPAESETPDQVIDNINFHGRMCDEAADQTEKTGKNAIYGEMCRLEKGKEGLLKVKDFTDNLAAQLTALLGRPSFDLEKNEWKEGYRTTEERWEKIKKIVPEPHLGNMTELAHVAGNINVDFLPGILVIDFFNIPDLSSSNGYRDERYQITLEDHSQPIGEMPMFKRLRTLYENDRAKQTLAEDELFGSPEASARITEVEISGVPEAVDSPPLSTERDTSVRKDFEPWTTPQAASRRLNEVDAPDSSWGEAADFDEKCKKDLAPLLAEIARIYSQHASADKAGNLFVDDVAADQLQRVTRQVRETIAANEKDFILNPREKMQGLENTFFGHRVFGFTE